MDRLLALTLRTLALACLCAAALLLIGGFIEFLIYGRWPDQSLLRVGYDLRMISARWFLLAAWGLTVRELLEMVPAALALLLVAPGCWFLGTRFGSR